MLVSLRTLMSALVLAGAMAQAPFAFASAPPAAERPSDQQRSDASRTAIERERRYAGLSLGDAIRQSLIDDDLDFAFSTMSALGQSAGDSAGARYFNGVRAFARRDFADAIDVLKDADTEDMLVASVKAWSLVGQGKVTEAVQAWDAYGDSGRKPFYATYRALMAEQAGQTEAALRHYRIAESTGELLFAKDLAKRYAVMLVKENKDSDALRMFDTIFGETKALDAGEAAFRQTLVSKRPAPLEPITPHAAVSGMMSNYASAGILVRMMRPEAGEETDKSASKTADTDTLFVGDALTFRTALLVDPGNVAARLSLARMFADLDEDEAAKKTLEPIVSGPRLNEARMVLSGIYASLENPKRGLEVLDLIPESARDADWWDRRGDLLIARTDYAQGLAAIRRSVASARGRGDWAQDVAQLSLANALNFAGKQDEARNIAQELVTRLEKRNPIRGAAAGFLTRFDTTRAAGLVAIRESLTAFGADGRTKIAVGAALAKNPETRAEGIQLLRDGVSEFPRSPVIMNTLGYTLVAYDIDLEEGYRILQKAHEARPNSGAIMDSFGRANYKLGNLEEAQRLIEGAIALRIDSPDPEIHDNLGDVYWHQGRQEDARAQWRKAKAIGGAYEQRDALDVKIRDGLTTPVPTRRDVPVVAEPGSV
jgi:tetratricopeptide (TPR) repeat protein